MSKYKVGDKVRIVKSDRGYSEDFTGQECAVKDVTSTGVKLSVTYKDGQIKVLHFQNDMVIPVEKWLKWDGEGYMPVPAGTSLNVEYLDGEITDAIAGRCGGGAEDWTHTNHPKDIIAYYVIGENKPEICKPLYSAELLQDNFKKLVEQSTEAATATDILQEATECLTARAVERDKGTSERSMKAAVTAFNSITGHTLTEEQGNMFMVCLKMSRSQGGKVRLDDYVDLAAYAALAGESAVGERC